MCWGEGHQIQQGEDEGSGMNTCLTSVISLVQTQSGGVLFPYPCTLLLVFLYLYLPMDSLTRLFLTCIQRGMAWECSKRRLRSWSLEVGKIPGKMEGNGYHGSGWKRKGEVTGGGQEMVKLKGMEKWGVERQRKRRWGVATAVSDELCLVGAIISVCFMSLEGWGDREKKKRV